MWWGLPREEGDGARGQDEPNCGRARAVLAGVGVAGGAEILGAEEGLLFLMCDCVGGHAFGFRHGREVDCDCLEDDHVANTVNGNIRWMAMKIYQHTFCKT